MDGSIKAAELTKSWTARRKHGLRQQEMKRRKYSSLDLFSGAGGFTLGLEASGFKSLGAIEIDEVAGRTFRKNFGSRPLSHLGPANGNVTRVCPEVLKRKLAENGIDELDLLVAGPPCQGFSKVGRGKLDSLASRTGAFLDDERNQLYRAAIEILRELRPRVFLFENVAGMLHLRGVNMAELVCQAVESAGYTVRCALLNTAWYGVPQTRERIFILGIRDDLKVVPSFPARTHEIVLWRGNLSEANHDLERWSNPEYFVPFESLPSVKKPRAATSVLEALDDLPHFTQHLEALKTGERYRPLRELFGPVPYRDLVPLNEFTGLMRTWSKRFKSQLVSDHFCRWTPRDFETFARMKHGDRYPEAHAIAESRFREALDRVEKEGGERPLRESFVPPYPLDCFEDKWRKLDPSRPSWTVTAHLGKDTYSHIHYDSRQARAVTIREAARLQSFPDAFAFEGNMGDAFRQIGNAVPPLLARAIGRAIFEQLRSVDAARAEDGGECPSTVAPPLLTLSK